MTKPKPCPFCGDEPIIEERNMGETYYQVACVNPDCFVRPLTDMHINKSVVIREWNKRYECNNT